MPRSAKVAACGSTTLSCFIRMTWSREIGRFGKGAIKLASSSQTKYGTGRSSRLRSICVSTSCTSAL